MLNNRARKVSIISILVSVVGLPRLHRPLNSPKRRFRVWGLVPKPQTLKPETSEPLNPKPCTIQEKPVRVLRGFSQDSKGWGLGVGFLGLRFRA